MYYQKHVVLIMATSVAVVLVVVVLLPLLVVIHFILRPTSLSFRILTKQELLEFRIVNNYLFLLPISRIDLSNIAVKWVAVLIPIRFMITVTIWTHRLLVFTPIGNGFSLNKYQANTQINQVGFLSHPSQLSTNVSLRLTITD